MDVVQLCKKYRHEGVVAIDLAGDESLNCLANPGHRRAYEVSLMKHSTGLFKIKQWALMCLLCVLKLQLHMAESQQKHIFATSAIMKVDSAAACFAATEGTQSSVQLNVFLCVFPMM